jgi:hypothetical protein
MFEPFSESSSVQPDSSQSLPCPPSPLSLTSDRFISWQIQLGLISPASNSWRSDWQSYRQTYAALLSANALNTDPILSHHIHIDVIRLSRYSPLFGAETQTNFQRMERILCLFARFSAPNGYRQAFHELLFPLYFVGITGGMAFNLELEICEAIAFFFFHSLINGTIVGDFFLSKTTESPLTQITEEAFEVVKVWDPLLHRHLEANDISPLLFAFSWLSVLFCQNYDLESLLKLWDFIFTDVKLLRETLIGLVAAHFMKLRGRLLGKRFPQIMEGLNGLTIESEVEAVQLCERIQQSAQAVGL